MLASLVQLLRRDTFSLKYIAEVDGVRFLAIFMVVWHHSLNVFTTIWGSGPTQRAFTDVLQISGFKGIHLFFTLSGFILALPFIKWRNGGAAVETKSYFIRRLFRLEPPYLIALILCFALEFYYDAVAASGRWDHFTAAFFYLHNILFERRGNVNGVAWTLEIETQFYLLAPLLFQVFRLRKPWRRWLLAGTTLGFAIAHFIYLPTTLTVYNYISYFLLGALVADFYADSRQLLVNNLTGILLAVALYVLIWYLPILESPSANSAFPFVVASFMFCVFNNDSLRKLLSLNLLTIIGGMCYSIYLLHYPLLFIIGNISKRLYFGTKFWENFAVQIPIYGLGVLLVCGLFYLCVEKPFMHLSAKRKRGGQSRQEQWKGVVAGEAE